MTPPDLRFTFEGRAYVAAPGATVASALMANGVRSWRRTRAPGAPRGLLCGIGTCFDCLVDVEAQRAVRACVTPLHEGDCVWVSSSRGGSGAAGDDGVPAVLRSDVLVVGGGPAGLAAASAAIAGGASVVLVDSAGRLGGQLLRQPSCDATGSVPPFSPWLATRHPSLSDAPGLTVVTAALWQLRAESGGFVAWLDDGRRAEATATVLASGATELMAPFPGWELPGVVGAGAAQALLKAHGQLIGRRVLVAGAGPFLLPVAAGLAVGGAKVLAVVEALPARQLAPVAAALMRHRTKAAEALTYAAALARHGVPLRTGQMVARCEPGPDGSVARAVVAATNESSGRRARSGRRIYEIDAVCTSFGFVPRLELARQLGLAEHHPPGWSSSGVACGATQATSVLGVFAAGEVTGIAGGEVAALEGAVAGASAAVYALGRELHGAVAGGVARTVGRATSTAGGSPSSRPLARARAFADRLSQVYRTAVPVELVEDDTVVCRCEDVPAGAIQAALTAGAASAREVRNATRCGMGYCQGRTCGPIVQAMVARALGTPVWRVDDLQKRLVASPVLLETVAGSDP